MSGSITNTTNSSSGFITNSIGKLAGIYDHAKNAIDYNKAGNASLLDFINKIRKYGLITKSRYEVTFSGIDDLTFFITDINVPTVRRNFGNLHWRGQLVEVPITIEYEHDFTITVLNDAKGILYSTMVNWLMTVDGDSLIDSGYTMTLRMLGDGENTAGVTIMFEGVRFKSVSGISASNMDSSISTFTVQCSAIRFNVVAGSLTQLGSAASAIQGAAFMLGQLTGNYGA